MSDSASAYVEVGAPGIVEKHQVNHSENEFARSTKVLKNVVTRETEDGTAGTFVIDREWRSMKETLPSSISPKTVSGRQRIKYHVLAQVWLRKNRNRDNWPRYCAELNRWRHSGDTYWEDADNAGAPIEVNVGDERSAAADEQVDVADDELLQHLSPGC